MATRRAVAKAHTARAFGADCVANILRQQQAPWNPEKKATMSLTEKLNQLHLPAMSHQLEATLSESAG